MVETTGVGVSVGIPADVTTLSEVLPDGLVVADGEARLVFANSRAGRVLGIDLPGRMGQPLQQAVALRDNDGRAWWEVADPWGTLHIVKGHREKLLWTEDGVEVLVTARYVRVGLRGPVELVMLSIRDAKGRQRAEQDHAALISTIAHELRSPLTSVKGFSTTLLRRWDRFTDEQKRFMIETIETDADRVTRLITELLDVSRIDAGRLDVRPQPVDVVAMAQRHAERLRAQDEYADRPISVSARDGLPEVWADPDRLNQILANLLENGLRHGEGEIRVQVGPAPEAANDGRSQVQVEVTDEGEGVALAHLPLIFNRFWHGQRRGSTGLGLYVVRGLVEAHGGHISVDRADGGGARFRFTLPAGPPEHLA
ncbi:ATP-binding protein [Dermatophilaceae bacterium Soc4.6]